MTRRRLLLLSLVVGFMVSGVFVPQAAHADRLGGKWPQSAGQSLYLYYSYGGGHRYLGNVYQGGVNWTNTPTRVYIRQWPGVPYRNHININDVWVNDDYYGQAALSPCNSCTYSSSSINFNTRLMDGANDFLRTKVATHEMGHVLGLAHTTTGGVTSIMYPGNILINASYNTPQSYDINEVNRIYP